MLKYVQFTLKGVRFVLPERIFQSKPHNLPVFSGESRYGANEGAGARDDCPLQA